MYLSYVGDDTTIEILIILSNMDGNRMRIKEGLTFGFYEVNLLVKYCNCLLI